MDKYEKQHQRNLSAYERQVSAIFNQAIKEATLIGVSIEDLADDEILSFDKLPKTKKTVSKMLNTLASNLAVCIVNGVQSSWTLANSREDELCNQVFGDVKDLLTDAQRKRYYSNNGDALQAFLGRKEAGLDLSERVWKYADEFKGEIEMGLDLGIRDGVAANKMQKDLQQYLQHPDMLFRRVRDKHGNLQLSKRAKAYHPGAGVYRSSYKNARRLTVTETNMAYRTADYLRWQNMDFVVGVRVVKSNNHPDTDICDELSAPLGSTANKGRGCYPKDFKFVGWHPHCRCHSESILKTEEELMTDNKRIMNGEEPTTKSVNTVQSLPKKFTDWMDDNKDRLNQAKNAPYFLKDNVTSFFCAEEMKQFRPMVCNILSQDKKYKDVAFDKATKGLKATHIGHNIDKTKGWYELSVQEVGLKTGHAVIFEKEIHSILNHKNTEGTWDGLTLEIAAAENGTANNIRNALKHCASKPNSDIAVVFFPNDNFNIENFNHGLSKFKGLRGTPQYHHFKFIYCIGKDDILLTRKKPE